MMEKDEKRIQLLPVSREDIEEIADIYEKYLNGGSYIRKHVLEGISEPDYIGYKAVYQDRIIGFISGREGIDLTYPHPKIEEKIRKMFPGQRFYSPDAMVVLPEFRQHNLAHRLSARVIPEIFRRGYDLLLTELWIYPDGSIPADGPVSAWGELVYQEDVPLYYKQLSDYGASCPVCGKNCRCGARIKILKPTDETVAKMEEN